MVKKQQLFPLLWKQKRLNWVFYYHYLSLGCSSELSCVNFTLGLKSASYLNWKEWLVVISRDCVYLKQVKQCICPDTGSQQLGLFCFLAF